MKIFIISISIYYIISLLVGLYFVIKFIRCRLKPASDKVHLEEETLKMNIFMFCSGLWLPFIIARAIAKELEE